MKPPGVCSPTLLGLLLLISGLVLVWTSAALLRSASAAPTVPAAPAVPAVSVSFLTMPSPSVSFLTMPSSGPFLTIYDGGARIEVQPPYTCDEALHLLVDEYVRVIDARDAR